MTRSGRRVGTPRRVPTRGSAERGAVTAEAAMVIPVLAALTIALAWLLSLAVTQVRLTDAAREVARAVARDEPRSAALALGARVAPEGTRFTVRRAGGEVVVNAATQVATPGGLLTFLPAALVDAEAVAAVEGP